MRSYKLYVAGIAMLLLILNIRAYSQASSSISVKYKTDVLNKVIQLLHENYIFPERVNKIEKFVSAKLKAGGYAALHDQNSFLQAINADLEKVGSDHHLNIFFGPQRVKQILVDEGKERAGKPELISTEWLRIMQYENFRLRKVERLDGNVGYFQFLSFAPLAQAKETLIGAMNFVRHSSALIIDLRDNGGGNAETMQFLLSYFLKDSMQIAEWRYRKDNRIVMTYVPADSTVKKIELNVPVYILISSRTSSAAEGFAHTLQQNKRAVVVGEQSKGEGNPGRLFALNGELYMMIPTIESKNYITGKSIDGIGVTPDITITADKALSKALLETYSSLANTSAVKELKQLYTWQIPLLQNELSPEALTEKLISNITGNYQDGKRIVHENCSLHYVNANGKKTKLNYIGKGVFQSADNKWLRLLAPISDAPVSELTWIWDDGGTEKLVRSTR